MSVPPITSQVELEAKSRPGGWVYAIDPAIDSAGEVPADKIIGAWPVNSSGVIKADFVANSAYRPHTDSSTWRQPETTLEELLQRCAGGNVDAMTLYSQFCQQQVWVYDRLEGEYYAVPTDDGRYAVYAFTDKQLAQASGWRDVSSISGRQLARDLPSDYKILVNPGCSPAAALDVRVLIDSSEDIP